MFIVNLEVGKLGRNRRTRTVVRYNSTAKISSKNQYPKIKSNSIRDNQREWDATPPR